MGLFEELKGTLFGGGDKNKLLESIMGLINAPQTGGLSGLAQTFKDKGLGDVVSSWIGTGKNLPVSADQINQALGSEQIQQISEKMGVSQEEASKGLAGLLPEIIDKLTPEGKVPEGNLLAQGLDTLKKKIFG